MDACYQGIIAYLSALCTTFTLYPYRDYVKQVSRETFNKINLVEYSKWRYKGMMINYQQPLLLASPWGLLYAGFVGGNGGFFGVFMGSVLFGHAKTALKITSHRMNTGGSTYHKLGQRGYASLSECARVCMKQFGVLSFFCGATAATLITMCWHGAALASLRRYERSSYNSTFGGNFFDAFRAHAGLTVLTNPLRNVLRSGMHQRDRPGGVRNFSAFLACEKQVYQEGVGVFSAALRTEGISFFLHGALRTTFKTSLPFAVTYGLFKSLGGHLGPAGRPRGDGQRSHYHHPRIRPLHM